MFRVHKTLLHHEKCVSIEILLPCGTSSQLEGTRFADTTSSRGSHDLLRGQSISSHKTAFPWKKRGTYRVNPIKLVSPNSLNRKLSSSFNSEFFLFFFL